MKKGFYFLLCSTLLLITFACEQENDEFATFDIKYLYGKWESEKQNCVFNDNMSGYIFNANEEYEQSHFTWQLIHSQLILQFEDMSNAETKRYIITELTKYTLAFYDTSNKNLIYNFSKSIDSYIDSTAIYGTWEENEIFFQYKRNGVGIKKNRNGSKDKFNWELNQDKLTVTMNNNETFSQIYVVTELSDTTFAYYNQNNTSETHILYPYYETYGEMKKREKENINNFIQMQNICVIDMETFKRNGEITDTAKNEFVLFENEGVYMQILRKGGGKILEDDVRRTFTARYIEYNIEDEDTISSNLYAAVPDKFVCVRMGDTFSASFTQGSMYQAYGNMVPKGWLLPFEYITPGYPDDKASKVRLIIPHSEGTTMAARYVYPAYYDITYMTER